MQIIIRQLSIYFVLLAAGFLTACSPKSEPAPPEAVEAPKGMVYVPNGSYQMGGKSEQAQADEFPRREIQVDGFFMDATEVTNSQFMEFVKATNYVTVAEREIDWEEMKKELPAGTPKPPDSVLMPGSLVFAPTEGPVDLNDYSQWWEWKIGANWKHPQGPDSGIEDRMEHPVVHIAWEDALAYAKWAGKRLPSEAEWEWAAMGGKNDVKYPWGDDPVEKAFSKANFWQGFFPYQNLEQDGFYSTSPVKSFPPNGYGLYDMAGNVWEFCQDKYHYQAYQQDITAYPKGPKSSLDPREPYAEKYVVRGGSFLCNDSYCSGYRVARRMSTTKDSGLNHTGFRCVKNIK